MAHVACRPLMKRIMEAAYYGLEHAIKQDVVINSSLFQPYSSMADQDDNGRQCR